MSVLNAAIDDWTQYLEDHDAVNDLAENAELASSATWFTEFASVDLEEDFASGNLLVETVDFGRREPDDDTVFDVKQVNCDDGSGRTDCFEGKKSLVGPLSHYSGLVPEQFSGELEGGFDPATGESITAEKCLSITRSPNTIPALIVFMCSQSHFIQWWWFRASLRTQGGLSTARLRHRGFAPVFGTHHSVG